jgi:hypothetical protein
MTWGEAWRVYTVLRGDPSTAIAAAEEGWTYSFSREAMLLADLYDLTYGVAAQGRNVKPYPRPWPDASKTVLGGGSGLPQDKVLALLARRGPTAEPPTPPTPPARPRDARGRFLPKE